MTKTNSFLFKRYYSIKCVTLCNFSGVIWSEICDVAQGPWFRRPLSFYLEQTWYKFYRRLKMDLCQISPAGPDSTGHQGLKFYNLQKLLRYSLTIFYWDSFHIKTQLSLRKYNIKFLLSLPDYSWSMNGPNIYIQFQHSCWK